MVKFYDGGAREAVEFLGVTSDESEKTLRAFLTELAIPWQQIREPFEGPLHKLYRISGEPTYFLIGRTGEILDTWEGSGQTAERVAKFLAVR